MAEEEEEESTDWPPPEWMMRVKAKNDRKIKYYVNKRSGLKCYSMPALLRILETEKSKTKSAQSRSEHSKSILSRGEKREKTEWLPSGWRLEWKVRKSGRRKGLKYRCYVEPFTGLKFYSEPEVSRYLKAKEQDISSSEPNKGDVSRHTSNKGQRHFSCSGDHNSGLVPKLMRREEMHNGRKIIIETTVDEDLPPGWLKEIRTKQIRDKVRKDTFYINPMVDYIFISKVDVLRYLETGKPPKNAKKRKYDSIIEDTDGCKIMGQGYLTSNDSKFLERELTRREENHSKKKVPSGKKTRTTTVDAVSKSIFEEAKDLNNGQHKQPSAAVKLQSQPTILVEGRSLDSVIEEETADTQPISKTKSRKQKQDKKAINLPNRSSGRLAGVKAQPVVSSLPIEHTIRATGRASQKAERVPTTGLVPNDSTTEKPERPEKQDKKATNVPSRASSRLAGVKIQLVVSSFPIEHTVRATRRASKPLSVPATIPVPNDSTAEKRDIDISKVCADSTALRFPRNTVANGPPNERVKIQKNVGNKKSVRNTEKNIQEPVSLHVEQVQDPPVAEQTPASIGTNGNESGPFCCTAIWSDPCFEFAFKTLTGAIPLDPLDDNLAIQDYIDHQLRTCSQSNGANASDITKPIIPSNGMVSQYDSGMPTALQPTQTEPAPPLPGGGHLPYASGLDLSNPK